MRADIHDGREQKLQSEAGYIDARPLTDSSTKTSCNARPDHTKRVNKRRCFPHGPMIMSVGRREVQYRTISLAPDDVSFGSLANNETQSTRLIAIGAS
jgi:hypothetical protein